jgi:iron complex transport system substrate-binding protein
MTVLLPLTLLLTAVGCSDIKNENPALADSAILESFNYPVTIQNIEFSEAPLTVASLSPAVTEILCDIGVSDKLVGRSEYCTYPDSIGIIETIGSPAKPDIQKIISIKPQVLITLSPMAYADGIELEQNGVKIVFFTPPESYYELVDLYAGITKIFYGNVNSDSITDENLTALDDALFTAQSLGISKSFVYILTEEMAVATGDMLESAILSVFGENVAVSKTDCLMEYEEIAAADPYIIFIAQGVDREKLPDMIKSLDAYTSGRIITVDNSYFERPTKRLAELINTLTQSVSAIAGE